MTTTRDRTDEWTDTANTLLDHHAGLTAEDLVKPFAEWLKLIGDIHFIAEVAEYLGDIEPATRERLVQFSAVLDRAADLVAVTAGWGIAGDADRIMPGIMARGIFEAITLSPSLRSELSWAIL